MSVLSSDEKRFINYEQELFGDSPTEKGDEEFYDDEAESDSEEEAGSKPKSVKKRKEGNGPPNEEKKPKDASVKTKNPSDEKGKKFFLRQAKKEPRKQNNTDLEDDSSEPRIEETKRDVKKVSKSEEREEKKNNFKNEARRENQQEIIKETKSGAILEEEKKEQKKEVRTSKKEKPKSVGIYFVVGALVIIAIILAIIFLKLKSVPKDEIAAQINGEPIYLSDLNKQYDLLPPFYQQIITKSAMLNQMINEMVLSQEIRKQGVVVYDGDINKAISDALNSSNVTVKELEFRLSESNVSMTEFRGYYKKQLEVNKLLEKFVFPTVNASEAEIKDVYDKNKARINQSYNGARFMIEEQLLSQKRQIAFNTYLQDLKAKSDIKLLYKEDETKDELIPPDLEEQTPETKPASNQTSPAVSDNQTKIQNATKKPVVNITQKKDEAPTNISIAVSVQNSKMMDCIKGYGLDGNEIIFYYAKGSSLTQQTLPVVDELEKAAYNIYRVDATSSTAKVMNCYPATEQRIPRFVCAGTGNTIVVPVTKDQLISFAKNCR